MPLRRLSLTILSGKFAICRLESGSPIPEWAAGGTLFSVTGTPAELSIVCDESLVPAGIKHEPGWICLQVHGPFAFTEVGILASLIGLLASADISAFAISTFDTDYVLLKVDAEQAARAALVGAGHNFEPPV
jgi:uncharacterized protein